MKKEAIQLERVLTTNDIVFKKVFASPQNSHILTGFINDILELGATDVSVENTYAIDDFREENEAPEIRYTQVDVLARLEDGSQVTIEMQVFPQRLFRERAFYYAANIYRLNYGKHILLDRQGGYSKGESKYSALRPVYSICIMAENEFLEDKIPIHEFHMYDVKNKIFYRRDEKQDVVTMIFLEIKKTSEEMKRNIKTWFDYFNKGNVAKDAPKYIQEACTIANYKNLSREEAYLISQRQKSMDLTQAREDYVWYEGKAEGKTEGKAEGKTEIIKILYANGMSIEEIATKTNISEEEIEEMVR